MRLGIDFGTTRVVVAVADRGNYPVVTFDDGNGDGREYFPSLVAGRGGEVRFGFAAMEVAGDAGWGVRRSLKRHLAAFAPGRALFGRPLPEVLRLFLRDLRYALLNRSNLDPAEPLEVAIAVPANAAGAQRMCTADAVRDAGFKVVRVLDEPSAAALEYAWRRPRDAGVRRRHVAVYDLGGGTFDASVIALSNDLHEVLSTEGISQLGGDDFDRVLLDLAAAEAGVRLPGDGAELDALLEGCRLEKERLQPNTRSLTVDLGGRHGAIQIAVAAFEEALGPLLERTIQAVEAVLARISDRAGRDVEAHTVIYQVGGASSLPAVNRALRERFGRRVWRSPYPHASVAIGLAIAAEEGAGTRVTGRLSRHFGIWREADEGRSMTFDPLFERDTPLPAADEPPRQVVRRSRAAHNIAHYRFIEASHLTASGLPAGDVTPWADSLVPLVPELAGTPLEHLAVERLHHVGPEVVERYELDADGTISVSIKISPDGPSYRLNPLPVSG